jgi:hypothetical protein
MEPQPQFNRTRLLNTCAAVVVLVLALSSMADDCFVRAYRNTLPLGAPGDFRDLYLAGYLARLKSPENLLYYPPSGKTNWSFRDLRVDGTTPYEKYSRASGLPRPHPVIQPPFSALVLAPFSLMSWKTAYFAWQLLCLAMMALSVYFALRLSEVGRPPLIVIAVAAALVFLFLPFRRSLAYGNIEVVIFALWVLGVFLFSRRGVAASAFCFALGSAIKVMPVFAVPLFVMRRQWRWLAWYGAWTVLLLIISVCGLGWQNHAVWAGQVAPVLSCGINSFGNRSLAGLVLGISNPGGLNQFLAAPKNLCWFNKLLSVICYCAFLIACWRKRRGARGLAFETILLPLVVLIVSPISWPQYYVIALLPLIYLWARLRQPESVASRPQTVLLAASTLLVGTALPEYVGRVLGPPGELFVMGAWVAATVGLLWVGMRMYDTCVGEDQLAPRADEIVGVLDQPVLQASST